MVFDRRLGFRHLIRAAILFGFAFYIVYLVRNDLILYYIAPKMLIFVKLSALALYAVSVYQGYAAFRAIFGKSNPICDCEPEPSGSMFKSAVVYGLLALPLLLGFLLPDASLSSALAAKKGVNLSSAGTIRDDGGGVDVTVTTSEATKGVRSQPIIPSSEEDKLNQLFPSDEFTEDYANLAKRLYKQELIKVPEEGFMEVLTAIDLYREHFIGKRVEISGFVHREEDMPQDRFVIARFAMSCCSADASPYGVMTQYPRASSFATDEWVKLEGTIGSTVFGGNDIMQLQTSKIERIKPPSNTYVYPNFDIFKAP